MRVRFSALAWGNIMRVMPAMAEWATVGQCSTSSGCAQGSDCSSLSWPARLRWPGMPATTDSYNARLR